MPIIVKTLGIATACFAAILIFSPAAARSIAAYAKQGKRLLALAVARVIAGIFLIVASFYCAMTNIVLAIGILTALAGAVPIALGIAKMTAFVDWWLAKSDNALRAMAAVSLVLGALLVYAA